MVSYPPKKGLPVRSATSDDEAVPGEDPSETTRLLLERLQAYKHACGYLEDYVKEAEKVQKSQAKDYEKMLKTVSNPLKQGHHFDQQLGGIAGLFENIRSNTQGIVNSHLETEKAIQGTVLPILARLHTEIKNKAKELSKGAGKGSKAVDKARNETQKQIELLGQYTAASTSSGGKIDASNDPYILQRAVSHRLHRQVMEENSNRQDLISTQDSFQQFEAHVLQTFQQALSAFLQQVGGQSERMKSMYSDIVATAQRIPPDFEFKRFVQRNNNVLVDPSAPQRSVSNISFPNQNHQSTQPLIAGTLERKSRALGALKGFTTGYYVIAPSKYLHQFKSDDDVHKDPTPEISLYLPDCTVGALKDERFTVKGKDASKGKISSAIAMSQELAFKAHSPSDAQKWYNVIAAATGATNVTNESPDTAPSSPVDSRNISGQQYPLTSVQTQGITTAPTSGTTQQTPTSGTQPTPMSASSGVKGHPGQY